MIRTFPRKHKFHSRLYSTPVLIGLFILILFLAKGVFDLYHKEDVSAKAVTDSQKRLNFLQEKQNQLEQGIKRLNTSGGIEDEIRDRFSVVKDGEHMALLLESRNAEQSQPVKQPNFFIRLWQKIWGK